MDAKKPVSRLARWGRILRETFVMPAPDENIDDILALCARLDAEDAARRERTAANAD